MCEIYDEDVTWLQPLKYTQERQESLHYIGVMCGDLQEFLKRKGIQADLKK